MSSRNRGFRSIAVFFLMASLAWAGSGCSRAEDDLLAVAAPAVATQTLEFSYEAFGQLHNDALDHLDTSGASPLGDARQNDVLLSDFLASRGVQPDEVVVDYAAAARFGETYMSGGPEEAVAKLAADGVISAQQQLYLKDVVRAVATFQAEDASPTQVWEYVLGVESQVSVDSKLNDSERDLLLKALTVMRYSALHWYGKSLQEAATAKLSKACKDCLRRNWWVFLIYDGAAALQAAVLGPWGSIGVGIFVSFWSTGIHCPQCY